MTTLPIPPELTPINTTGDQLKTVIGEEFAALVSEMNAAEIAEALPYQINLTEAVYWLSHTESELQLAFPDLPLDKVIELKVDPQIAVQRENQAKIDAIAASYATRREKLAAVGMDVSSSPPEELLALVATNEGITPASVRAGFQAWINAQIEQERAEIEIIIQQAEASKKPHLDSIGVFAQFGSRLTRMSTDDLITRLTVASALAEPENP